MQGKRYTQTGRRRVLQAAAAAVVAATLAACGSDVDVSRDFMNPAAALPAGASVAVLPFENLTPHRNAGVIVADMVTTELYRLGRFTVREGTQVRHRLAADRTDLERLTDTTYAQEVGKTLGVDAVLVGSVSEYGYQNGLREDPVVGLNARLVRSGDGAVAWATSLSEVGGGYFTRDSVNEVAQRAVARMLSGLRTPGGG